MFAVSHKEFSPFVGSFRDGCLWVGDLANSCPRYSSHRCVKYISLYYYHRLKFCTCTVMTFYMNPHKHTNIYTHIYLNIFIQLTGSMVVHKLRLGKAARRMKTDRQDYKNIICKARHTHWSVTRVSTMRSLDLLTWPFTSRKRPYNGAGDNEQWQRLVYQRDIRY